jgi:hypothetical protein
MKQIDFTGIVPPHYTGKEIEADAVAELKNENEAAIFYEVVKERLLDINNWHRVAGLISATFQLVDAGGEPVERAPQIGDYVRIDIPGPGSKAGEGYDWVHVEEVKEINDTDIQSIAFRVRPAGNPRGDSTDIAHFYSEGATSTFVVTRQKEKVVAWIIDRNIEPNDHPESLTDKIRNTGVGIGAIGIFSKMQWQRLANGLVERTN